MAAPSYIQFAEIATWPATGASKTTSSFNVLAGDLLVAAMGHEDGGNTWTVTGGSLTWTLRQGITTDPSIAIYTAVVDSDKSMTVTFTPSITVSYYGGTVVTWRSHGGVGASSSTTGTGAPTLNITTTGANSAVMVVNVDTANVSPASRTWRTNAGTLTEDKVIDVGGGSFVFYEGTHRDAGSIGTYAVGLTAPGSQTYSIAAFEILGTGGGAAASPNFLTLLGAGA